MNHHDYDPYTRKKIKVGSKVRLTETVKTELSEVLRPTQHKTGHFEDVRPSQALGSALKTN